MRAYCVCTNRYPQTRTTNTLLRLLYCVTLLIISTAAFAQFTQTISGGYHTEGNDADFMLDGSLLSASMRKIGLSFGSGVLLEQHSPTGELL